MEDILKRSILFALTLTLLAGESFAQDSSRVVILSPRVGLRIDRAKSDYFRLFTQIKNFESAEIRQVTDSTYCADIVLKDRDGSRTDTVIYYTETNVFIMAEKVNHFEELVEGTYHMGTDLPKLHFADGSQVNPTDGRRAIRQPVTRLVIPGTSIAPEEPTQFCRNAIYFEILGQGIFYSINYDYRFTPHIGLRAGFTSWSTVTFIFVPGVNFTAFPIVFNYLTGERTSHLEMGIGVIPAIVSVNGEGLFFGGESEGNKRFGVLGTATLGYRAQARDGGFVFRIGLTPLFTFKKAFLTGGLSLGYAF